MKIVPYKAEHMRALKLQSAQLCNLNWMPLDQAEQIEQFTAFTALDGDEVLVCAGVLELWAGRGAAWAFLADGVGHRMVAVHRAVRRYFDVLGFRRLEAEVAADFPQGHRWMRLLGFELECPRMRGYFPDGSDAALYARVV
jgi:hypothetical protein